MNKLRIHRIAAGVLLCALYLCFAPGAMAQHAGHATDFRTHQDYEGPALNQKKTEFSGKDASPLGGPNKVLVKGADMRNFREDGSLIMAAQAPECVYDARLKQARSSGPLQMHTGDGRFFIEGVGFMWNEGESSLQLSNRVHSILHSDTPTNGQPPTETVIYADRFDYEMKTGLATYLGHVRVNDPKMKLTCEILIVNLANSSAFTPGDIIDLPSLRNALNQPADSDKVSQYVATRLAPATQKLLSSYGGETNSPLQKALAEDLNQIIQSGPVYDAERFAGVKLSPETSNLLKQAPSGPDLVRLNRALLLDAYPQAISRNQVPQPAGRPDSIVATNNVVIDYAEDGAVTHATGDKAVYTRKTTGTVTNELMELSGNPRLERTNGWMTADLITMDRTAGMIHGAGNYHSVFKKEPPKAGQTNAPPAGDTEIFCDTFDYNTKTRAAVYLGHVRATDPQMNMTSERLVASLPEKGGKPDHIVAETNVVIDFNENGQRTHAVGEKAVYDLKVAGGTTNEIMQLTGNPILERTNGWLTADLLVMDRTSGLIHGIGNHHSIIKKQTGADKPAGPATADTEIFSDNFDYNSRTRVAVYLGHVRVIDPQMNLTGGIATAWLPEKEGRPERIVAETNVIIDFFGSPLFSPGDIVNLPLMSARLKQPSATDLVSQYVSAQLSPATRSQLAQYHGGTNAAVQTALADDFNKLIQAGPIYDAPRFAGVKLQPATSNLLAQAPQGLDQVWLNRKLLIDAYPTELSKNNFIESGEKTHATGEMAVYTYSVTGFKTNETVVLTGNPMLGRPSGWTTADKIILDRASGRIRSIGHSYSKAMPTDLNKTNNVSKTNGPAPVHRVAN